MVVQALHQEDNYVHWLDCGPAFYNQSGLLPELYTDGLHLTTLGYDVLAACLQPSVEILWCASASLRLLILSPV